MMIVGGSILDLSNLIWTEGCGDGPREGIVYIVSDFESGVWKECREYAEKYFFIYYGYGDARIEYSLNGVPHYLAVRAEDGGYVLEGLEPYIKRRGGEYVFDILDLPDEFHGIRFQRSLSLPRTPEDRGFNRWRKGYFDFDKVTEHAILHL